MPKLSNSFSEIGGESLQGGAASCVTHDEMKDQNPEKTWRDIYCSLSNDAENEIRIPRADVVPARSLLLLSSPE